MHMKFSVGTGRISDTRHVAQLARTADECGYSRISFPDTPAEHIRSSRLVPTAKASFMANLLE